MGSSSPEREKDERQSEKASKVKKSLGWIEWLRGWLNVIFEMLFQRIAASHLQNPMPLPPVNNLTCIVTGSTSGIGREIARYENQPILQTSCCSLCLLLKAFGLVLKSGF